MTGIYKLNTFSEKILLNQTYVRGFSKRVIEGIQFHEIFKKC